MPLAARRVVGSMTEGFTAEFTAVKALAPASRSGSSKDSTKKSGIRLLPADGFVRDEGNGAAALTDLDRLHTLKERSGLLHLSLRLRELTHVLVKVRSDEGQEALRATGKWDKGGLCEFSDRRLITDEGGGPWRQWRDEHDRRTDHREHGRVRAGVGLREILRVVRRNLGDEIRDGRQRQKLPIIIGTKIGGLETGPPKVGVPDQRPTVTQEVPGDLASGIILHAGEPTGVVYYLAGVHGQRTRMIQRIVANGGMLSCVPPDPVAVVAVAGMSMV
jgi:hypothetical protein